MSRLSAGAGFRRLQPQRDFQSPKDSTGFQPVVINPFYRIGHDVLLPTRVDNAKPVLFLIDTGASESVIDPDYAGQFTGVRSEERITMKGISGKVQKVESAGHLTLGFAHYRQPVPGLLAVPLSKVARDSPRMTGIFGVTTLTLFRLQIDYRDGLINLDYVGAKN